MEPFQVRVAVRGYELDRRGHVNQAVYLQYAEHARWECLRAAGITDDDLYNAGIGPVALEATIRYFAELRDGDEVDVGCRFRWSGGKTFELDQPFRRPDGSRVAEVVGVSGLLDLAERRLIADPGGRMRTLATAPALLGL